MNQAEEPQLQVTNRNSSEEAQIMDLGYSFLGIRDKSKKTAVSILQELLASVGSKPAYEMFETDSTGLRKCRVTFWGITAEAEGKSKIKVKHAAARALILQLATISLPDILDESSAFVKKYMEEINKDLKASDEADYEPPRKKIASNEVLPNFVGLMNEHCKVSLKLPAPVYELKSETGLHHNKWFTVQCTLANMKTSGEGKNKKIAKQQAAKAMYEIVKVMLASRSTLDEKVVPQETTEKNAGESQEFPTPPKDNSQTK